MKKITLLLLCCIAFTFNALAHHDIDGPFDELRVNGKIRLVLEPGAENAVRILEDEDKVIAEVREGVLVVKRKEMWRYRSYKKYIDVVVTYKDKLRKISADAGAEISSTQILNTSDALRLSFGTGAIGALEVNLEDLEVSCGEGAILDLSGSTIELTARSSTGGELEAFDLQTQRAYAKANTGGVVEITVTDIIEANAHTGGIVEYRGSPTKENISNELGGHVRSVAGG